MATMVHCHESERELLGRLLIPERNRYYYGKLLDAHHFTLEQRYGNAKRWLVNRLTVGTGVICGLDVQASADRRRVRVRPGVAIDGFGREIIVPEPSPWIDPTQPTDDCGRAAGDRVADRAVTLSLCYLECDAEPAAAPADACEPEGRCEYGLVRERYRLRIESDRPRPEPGLPDRLCAPLFGGAHSREERLELLCRLVTRGCPDADPACVALAEITLDDDGLVALDRASRRPAIVTCAARSIVLSNSMLLELILCLADRVDVCCGDTPEQTTGEPPVITAVFPPNQAKLIPSGTAQEQQWRRLMLRKPRIELTFDVAMRPADLDPPGPWLRARLISISGGTGTMSSALTGAATAGRNFTVAPAALTLDPGNTTSTLGAPGSTVVYGLDLPGGAQGGLVFLMADSDGGTIRSLANGIELDADWNPVIPAAEWTKLWNLAGPAAVGLDLILRLLGLPVPPATTAPPAPQLPSGDGTPRGRFVSAFLYQPG